MQFIKKIFNNKDEAFKKELEAKGFSPEQQENILAKVKLESTEIKGFTPTMTPQMYEIKKEIN